MTIAIFSAIQAFINPDEEVLLIQPFYDCYPAAVWLAGGTPIMTSLTPSSFKSAADWTLDFDELASKITSKTKMLILNNPNNPLGKVYTLEELNKLAQFAEQHDLIVIADEVYETLVFKDAPSPFVKFGIV